MKKILVIGAGLSSPYLIRYLLQKAAAEKWTVTVADFSLELAQKRCGKWRQARAIAFDVQDKQQREQEINAHDLVLSLLPPALHLLVAKDCVKHKKHLVTASYISEGMQSLHKDALKAGVLLLNECGLDPGIDHLSAMHMLDRIRKDGGEIISFRSYCGGLVAPEHDDNPWHYKFTWNPRNVVMAGNATARYTQNGQLKYIPYNRIFLQTESIKVKGYGTFEAYANRDSNNYISPYGLEKADTVLRGTLRRPGFCKAWDLIIKLGLTDDSFVTPGTSSMSYKQWLDQFLPKGTGTVPEKVCQLLQLSPRSKEFKQLQWLGLWSEEKITLPAGSPAQVLQELLQQKWKLLPHELDMIVMQHELSYRLNGKEKKESASLVVKGEDAIYTAMAKTVGLPMAIAAGLILKGKIKSRGVQMPLSAEFYEPMLKELEREGISFF